MTKRLSSLVLVLALAACGEGEKGDPGDTGADGAAGADGADGATGADGADAAALLSETEWVYEARYGCEQGYQVTRVGLDDGADGGTAGDGVLQAGEVAEELLGCLGEDVDDDGALNLDDNCVEAANADQRDGDFDGTGDVCDEDTAGRDMWATTRGNERTTSSLYRYDTADGTATLIGDTGHALIALQVNPADGQLYAITRGYGRYEYDMDPGGCDACLVTLDTATGAATLVAELDDGPMPSLAFLPDGTAYGWTEDGDAFLSIDTSTGVCTYAGMRMSSAEHSMGATSDGTLYWMNYDGLYTLDPSAETATLVGDPWQDWEAEGGHDRIRGDVDAAGAMWIGTDGEDEMAVVDLTFVDGPQILGIWPQPPGVVFHTMTFLD